MEDSWSCHLLLALPESGMTFGTRCWMSMVPSDELEAQLLMAFFIACIG